MEIVLCFSEESDTAPPPAKQQKLEPGEWDDFAEFFEEAKKGQKLDHSAEIAIKIMAAVGKKATETGYLKSLMEKLQMPDNLDLGGPVPKLNDPIFYQIHWKAREVDKKFQKLQQILLLPYIALAKIADKAVSVGGDMGKELKALAVHGMCAQSFGLHHIHQSRMNNTAENLSRRAAKVLQKNVVPTQMFGENFFALPHAKLQEVVVSTAKGTSREPANLSGLPERRRLPAARATAGDQHRVFAATTRAGTAAWWIASTPAVAARVVTAPAATEVVNTAATTTTTTTTSASTSAGADSGSDRLDRRHALPSATIKSEF